MRFARFWRSALVVVVLAGAIAAPGAAARSRPSPPAHSVPGVDARVVGTFAMSATVTVAVHVRGERVGQRLARTWTIVPSGCQGSVCQQLALDRLRSGGLHDQLTLGRVGRGRYVGRGVFFAALSCLGRIDPYGSRVPYRIALTVGGAAIVQGIRFAQRITATYVNPTRSDRTRCPLGPSHDAARYAGRLGSPLPSPPTVAFSAVFGSARDSASFTDTSSPGNGGAAIVSRLWQFGDSSSGAADISTLVAPVHQFSAPGTYAVSLTVTDANGLSSTGVQVITAPAPPHVSFSAAEQGPSLAFSFTDGSTPGLGGAPIVGWHWDFGDPASGSQDSATAQDPSHTFSAPGNYLVTLTVTDANGFQSFTTLEVIAPP